MADNLKQRYSIVFNGQLYNRDELYSHLQDKENLPFTVTSADLILALYDERSSDMIHLLRGMFSFVIYDRDEQTVFGARDPFGIKPFYYQEQDENFYVASKATNLPHSKQLNLEALQDYLTYQYVPGPESMMEGVKVLPPGHFLWKRPGHPVQIQPYWQPVFKPHIKHADQLKDQLLEALKESVAIHLDRDASVGAFLSGGIDSTALVTLAKEIRSDIKTFTVGFKDQGYNELSVATETAEALGVEHRTYLITPEEVLKELPKIIRQLDQPLADPAAIPLYFAAREASRRVDTVLSGEGADELFGGYDIYREPRSLKPVTSLPVSLRAALKRVAHLLPDWIKGKGYLIRGCTPLEERYIGNAKLFDEHEKAHFLKHYDELLCYRRWTRPLYDMAKHLGYDLITTMQHVDLFTWLAGDILPVTERVSSAHDLDIRMPFLDKQVFDVAAQIHPNLKVRRGTGKWLLREALRGHIPQHVIDRPKLGCPVPIRHWLKNEWYEWARQLIKESETDHLFDKAHLLKLLEAHRRGSFDTPGRGWISHKGRHDYGRKLWAVLTFMIWHQIFVEARDPELLSHHNYKVGENVVNQHSVKSFKKEAAQPLSDFAGEIGGTGSFRAGTFPGS